MRKRSIAASLLVVLLVALVAAFTIGAAVAKDNPPGCKNEVPGPDGFMNPNCEPPVNECTDGVDNDNDGATDAADRDCDNGSTVEGGSSEPACSNGVDDDGDGKADGADPGCSGDNDNDETDPTPAPACSNGVDDDGDGKIDTADPGCSSPDDNDETDPPTNPACSDGIDNDGDGKVDGDDPGCSNPDDNDETDPPTGGGPTCDDPDGDGTDHSSFDPDSNEGGPVSGIVHQVDQALPSPLGGDGGVVTEVNCAIVVTVEEALGING